MFASVSSVLAEDPAPVKASAVVDTAATPDAKAGVFDMSIDQLLDLDVTSPAKKSERLADVASAIFVITSEDIRRSTATNIPDLLRMVPGLHVARVDGNQAVVSSRGFSGVFADKLLVLMDGRSVYTPLFGGVFWNEVDAPLENIDRIEVIRGPGATLYGANAVNGVINIITKSAGATQGGLIRASGGNEERGSGLVQYGSAVGDTQYRAYGQYFNRDGQLLEATKTQADDSWQNLRTGFRSDTQMDRDTVTFQGDYFYGENGWNPRIPSFDSPTYLNTDPLRRYQNGGNLQGRWSRAYSDTSSLAVQAYYDYIDRNDRVLGQRRNTVDLNTEFRFSPLSGNDVVSGMEYRFYHDTIDESSSVGVDPQQDNQNLATGFVQDEITLRHDLRLILGTKVEHNDLSGFEVLPNIRLIATPDESNSVWGAVSKAVRSPARFNHDGRLVLADRPGGSVPGDQGLPSSVVLYGTNSYDSEDMVAYEVGYRSQVSEQVSFDIATFYNVYHNLETAEPAGAPSLVTGRGNPYIEIPYEVQNLMDGTTKGVELVVDTKPTNWWRLMATYSFLEMNMDPQDNSQDFIYSGEGGRSPRNQYMIRSLINLPYDMEFDTTLNYVGSLPDLNIQSYAEASVRLGWHATKNLELSVNGQNLLQSEHTEYTSSLVDTAHTQMQRGVYGKATWRF